MSIISNRDKIFISSFWRELLKLYNTTLMTSTTYHPQIDGQSEMVNHCLEMYLSCCVHETPKRWKIWIPLAKFWYNSSLHSSLESTTFKVLYGYDAPVVDAPMLCSTENKSLQDMLAERHVHIDLIKKHLAAT
jgi:hypothetical protein